jgi:CRISPR-associated protein Cmr6
MAPQPSLRSTIARLNASQGDANTGLWLDRMLPEQLVKGEPSRADQTPHTRLIQQACGILEPTIYQPFFDRWQATLRQLDGARTREGSVRGRLVVGLGAESVLETAIALHRVYGVPYIPGSALKGLAAAYAHQRLVDDTWRKPPLVLKPETPFSAHEIMFGSTRSAGYVTFFDALYKPASGHKGKAIWPDVITVHHPGYYQGRLEGGALPPPADWDNPTPVSFVSATGVYLVALAGPEAWVTQAFHILALALDEIGIGAKTSSGYGRVTLEGLDEARRTLGDTISTATDETRSEAKNGEPVGTGTGEPGAGTPQAQDRTPAEVRDLLRRLADLPAARVATEINRFVVEWRNLTYDEAVKRQVAAAIIEKVRAARRERASVDRPWYKELLAALTE